MMADKIDVRMRSGETLREILDCVFGDGGSMSCLIASDKGTWSHLVKIKSPS